MGRIARMAHAHVPEGVQDSLIGEDAIGGHQVIEHFGGNIDHVLRHYSLSKRTVEWAAGGAIPISLIFRKAADPVEPGHELNTCFNAVVLSSRAGRRPITPEQTVGKGISRCEPYQDKIY